jgi:hypothetical protein
MTERQKYLRLLAEVIEDLPTSAIDKAVRAGYAASSMLLSNVRMGRAMNLPHLVALIEYGLPSYKIPVHLLPVVLSRSSESKN